MRRTAHVAVSMVLLMAAGAFAATPVLKVERDLSLPSFIGYVENEFIVVVTDDVARSLETNSKALSSANPFTTIDELADLSAQFDVALVRKQFPRHAIGKSLSGTERDLARYYKVAFNTGTLQDALAAFSRAGSVEKVEPIGIHTILAEPNDPYYKVSPNPSFPYDQWHYWDTHGIGAEQAWDTQAGDATVVVGVLDSGTRYFHVDLGGNVAPWGPANPYTGGNIFINSGEVAGNGVDDDGNGYVDDVVGWDFVASTGGAGVSCIDQDCGTADNDPDDGDGHGTHVSGTVGAITNNNILVAGVAGGFSDGTTSGIGNGVKVLPMRIGYHARYRGITTGIVRMDYAAEAMDYISSLVDNGVNVASINCSWGSSNSGGLGAATTNLIAHDVVVVVAAGNSGSTSADYLNARGDCVDVAATDRNGNGASFSNHGSWVDVAAPGVEILSTYRSPDDPDPASNYIALLDGTSMAAPHVAGIIGLLESCDPSLTASQKISLVINNTTPYSDSRDLGSGIANVNLALNAAGTCGGGPTCDVTADFSGSATSGCASLTVNFTDQSTGTGIDSWSWNFGDGGTSTAQNPSHTYTAAGTYTVSLTANSSSQACGDTQTKTGYITVSAPPTANFTGSPISGTAPLNVSFTDASTGNPTGWSWTFGDGGTSTAQNPSHSYASAGTYTVSLTVTNACGSDGLTRTNYITVTEPQASTDMYVSSMTVTRVNVGQGFKQGQATVTILDNNNQPVAGATVTGNFTGPIVESGRSAVTNSSGVALVTTAGTAKGGGDECFEVTNVADGGTHTYVPSLNNVTQACESGVVFDNGSGIAFLPNQFGLGQNYPNPFNPTTEISFSLPSATKVTLEVFNIRGQKVATLADGAFGTGQHTVTWDATQQPSGVYLYRLTTETNVETRKMMLIK